jgi:hypothetical protein
MGDRENPTRNNPTMNREYEQPGTNMGDTGEQNNKQPTQRKATRDGKPERNRTTATQWETQRKGVIKKVKKRKDWRKE